MIMGTELYDIVSHFVVVSEQQKHGLITPEIKDLYLAGVKATIKPEPTPVDDEMTLRTLTLLDALVFFGSMMKRHGGLRKGLPHQFGCGQEAVCSDYGKPVDSPFTLRRNVVSCSRPSMRNWKLGSCQRCTTPNSPR